MAMPLYDYACPRCGPFSTWGTVLAHEQPADCPDCGEASPRMVAAPNLSCTSSGVRLAHERNERSAHEPRLVTHEQMHGTHSAHGHGHAYGHAHGHGHGHAHRPLPPAASRLGTGLRQSSRRSMIGH
jgi:putative FmdB family regulatory protein